jgi:hypothetical protein
MHSYDGCEASGASLATHRFSNVGETSETCIVTTLAKSLESCSPVLARLALRQRFGKKTDLQQFVDNAIAKLKPHLESLSTVCNLHGIDNPIALLVIIDSNVNAAVVFEAHYGAYDSLLHQLHIEDQIYVSAASTFLGDNETMVSAESIKHRKNALASVPKRAKKIIELVRDISSIAAMAGSIIVVLSYLLLS